MKIVVFLPCTGKDFPQKFFKSYLRARTNFHYHFKDDEIVEIEPISELTEDYPNFTPNMGAIRSYCVARMIEGFEGYYPDTSLWFDIDQELQPDTIVKLLKHKEPVVSGMYFLKGHPNYPVVYQRHEYDEEKKFYTYKSMYDYPPEDCFEADMIGMGCVKIDREVFLKLDPPYFRYREHSKLENTDNLDFLIKHKIDNNTEEPIFWEQVKEKGYKIIVDPLIHVGHIGEFVYKREHWLYNKITGSF